MADGRDINIRIKIDPDRVGAQAAQQSLAGIGREALRSGTPLESVVKKFKAMSPAAIAAAAGIATVVAALAVITLAVRGFLAVMSKANSEFAPFEQGMRNVAAVSGATQQELKRLSTTALELASATRFNPKQVSEGLYALASAGQDVNEQLASLPAVLNFAEAAQADLGLATEVTVSTLANFSMEASEANRVVDVFTAAIGASALNATRLQYAMAQAAPAGAALGQTLETTSAATAILTTALGSGEMAGTGFKSMALTLIDKQKDLGISAVDAAGNFRPLLDIIRDLEKQGKTSTEILDIMGNRAGPALAILVSKGSEALAEMTEKIQSNGQAAEVAAKQLDTLQGDQDQLASKIQEFWVRVGDVSSEGSRTVTQAQLEFMTSIVNFINENEAEIREFTHQVSESFSLVSESIRNLGSSANVARPFIKLLAAELIGISVILTSIINTANLMARMLPGGAPLMALLGGKEGSAADPAMVAKMTHALNIALAEFAARQREAAEAAAEGAKGNEILRKSKKQLKDELKDLNRAIREHQDEIRKAEERVRAAKSAYAEWAEAIKAVEDMFGGLDILDIIALLEAQGAVLPTTAAGWQDLAASIGRAADELDRLTSERYATIEPPPSPEPVFPKVDPSVLKEIEEEHAKTYGKMAAEAEAVMEQAWRNVQDIVADSLAEILKSGELDWKKLANALLDIFAQMLAKLLVMWAINAAKRIALEKTVTQSAQVGSGGGGNLLGSLGSLFGLGSGGAATTTGTVAAGDTLTGTVSAGSGVMGAAAIGAIMVLLVAYLHSEAKKAAARKYHDIVNITEDLGLVQGAAWNEEFQKLAIAARDGIRSIVDALGAEMSNFPDIKVQIQGSGKRFKAWVAGEMIGIFDSYEEALEAAVLEGFSQADFSGIAPELADALQRGAFDSVEQLLEVNDIFKEIQGSLDPVGLAIDELNTKLDIWRRKLEAVGIPTNVLDAFEAKSWQQIRDSITGTTKSAKQLFDEQREQFNRKIEMQRAEQEAAKAAAEAQHAAAQVEVARLEAMLAGLIVINEFTQKLFENLTQQLATAQALLASSAAAAAAANAALGALPKPIGPGEFKGGKGTRKADRERLDDILRDYDLSKLSDLQQALQAVNDRWDDAIKLAHGDAAAIERIAKARQEEIQAIKDQAVEDFYGRLRRFERGPQSPLGDALSGVNSEQRDLIEGAKELAEALGFTEDRLKTMIDRIKKAAQEQREIILQNAAQDLLLSALDFLGKGEEAERIRFEIQKAQLLIAYEELKIAALKYGIELDLLKTIGGLIDEIIDLDFDGWKKLHNPVRDVNRGLRDTNTEFDRLADRLSAAKDNIREFLNSLDRNEMGGLSPKDALENALSQFMAIVKAAKSGDINAMEAFPSIGQDLLKLAREYYGSDPRFAAIFDMVRQAGIDLLDVSQAREGDVIFDERFYAQQQQQTAEQQRTNSLIEENNRLQRENHQLMRRVLAA